jgi:hypothetical protein
MLGQALDGFGLVTTRSHLRSVKTLPTSIQVATIR